MNRIKLIQLTILKRLESSQPYALPESQLLTEVNGCVRPKVKAEELSEAIETLGGAECIARLKQMANLFTAEEAFWLITETGSTVLARQQAGGTGA